MSKSQYKNSSLERGFGILEFLAQQQEPTTLSATSAGVGLPVSTTFRFLSVLLELGYVHKTDAERYSLGYRLFKLSNHANELAFIKRAANQTLARLAQRIGLTVHMGGLEGTKVTYHAKFESIHSMNIVSAVGSQLDAHVSAIGKTLLAHLPGPEFRSLYKGTKLRRHTDNSIATIAALEKELARIREQGYALDYEEIIPGLRCVAVPVYDHENQLVCAISISGSIMHITEERVPDYVATLKTVASRIRQMLAGDLDGENERADSL